MNKFTITMTAVLVFLAAPLATGADGREVIHATAELVQPLMPGMKAADFVVRDAHAQTFEFKAGAHDKPVILTFYRGGWCPYCNLHLAEMRLTEQQLRKMGFDIWFISIDKPELLLESLDDPDIGYTIFSDSSLNATRAYGVAFRVDDETVGRYLKHEIDLEAASGENHHVLPAPSTFLIGTDGIISFAYTNPDYHARLHPDVLLAAASAYLDDTDKRLRQRREQQRKKSE